MSTAREYESVRWAFGSYVSTHVNRGDIVVVTSAPPTTLLTHSDIRKRGALGVYWLQDYYPQLVRAVWDPPSPLRRLLNRYWRRELTRWPHVVKAAANLGYHGSNTTVIRNWNTLDLGVPRPFRRNTALYTGNLGYGHHLPSFLSLCEELRSRNFEITVRGDGPGISQLPSWINVQRPYVEESDLIRSYWETEVHLVAGHPVLNDAVFPSKFWNAHATGRKVLASGFTGVMTQELEIARTADYRAHLPQWKEFLLTLHERQRRITANG